MSNKDSIWTKDYILVCLSSFLMFMNFYMLVVGMPIYVKNELQGSAQEMSAVVALYIFGTVLTRPFSGMWADKIGKKKISVIFSLLFFACTISFLGFKMIVPLLTLRFIQGLIYAVAGTGASALAIDMIPANKKGEGIGYYSMFMSLAMVVGPAIGLKLVNDYSYNALLIVCSVVTFLAFVIMLMIKKTPNENSTSSKKKLQFADFLSPKAIPVCIATLIYAFGHASIMNFVSLYAKELNFPQMAPYFFLAQAIAIIVPRPYVGKLFDRKGANYLIYPGMAFYVLGTITLAFATTPTVFLIAGALAGLGYGAIFPCFQTLAVKLSPANKSGAGTATFFVFFDIGYGSGSFVLSYLVKDCGYTGVYLAASAIVLIAAIAYYIITHLPKVSTTSTVKESQLIPETEM